jgi:bacterioferritin-associated ferredoxin
VIVCHCRRITDRQIRKMVQNGATSVGQVARACGAATGCGGCATVVHEIVNDELGRAPVETITSPLLANAS